MQQRRYRERHKAGIKVETFEVDHGLLHQKLVTSGMMTEEEFADGEARRRMGNQVSFTWELGRDWSNVGAYAEQVSPTNPFEAYISPGTDVMNSARLRLEWAHHLGQPLDATLWAAGGRSFGDSIELSAAVPAVGTGLESRH
jgi:hypothetical protein